MSIEKIGAIAIDRLGLDDDMLVIAGDNVLDFCLTKFVAYAKEKKSSCIMRYYEPDEKKLLKCGVVTLDESDRILNMTEKSPTLAMHWCCPHFIITRVRMPSWFSGAFVVLCHILGKGSL